MQGTNSSHAWMPIKSWRRARGEVAAHRLRTTDRGPYIEGLKVWVCIESLLSNNLRVVDNLMLFI